jgi:hypothetical protein
MRDAIASRIVARTTLDIDPTVLQELRRRGELERKSMGQVASELLAGALAKSGGSPATAFEWTTANLGNPRVDLEDKEALRRILDEDT